MACQLVGDILTAECSFEARSKNVLLINGEKWALYERGHSGEYVRVQKDNFTFTDHRRDLEAIVDGCKLTLIKVLRGARGRTGPQGPVGPPGESVFIYGSAYNVISGFQFLDEGTIPAVSGQYVIFSNQGTANGITLNNAKDGLVLSETGDYEAIYLLSYIQLYRSLAVRLVKNGNEIPGSEVTSNSTQVNGVVQFSARSGDVISLANGTNHRIALNITKSAFSVATYGTTSGTGETMAINFTSQTGSGAIYVLVQYAGSTTVSVSVSDTNKYTCVGSITNPNIQSGISGTAQIWYRDYDDLSGISAVSISFSNDIPMVGLAELIVFKNTAVPSLGAYGSGTSGNSSNPTIEDSTVMGTGFALLSSLIVVSGTYTSSTGTVDPHINIHETGDPYSYYGTGADALIITSNCPHYYTSGMTVTAGWAAIGAFINPGTTVGTPINAALDIKLLRLT